MSDKMTCPGCNSYTSTVLRNFQDYLPCSYCGLSAEAAWEIVAVRRKQADEALKTQLEQAIKARDKVNQEATRLRSVVADIRRALADLDE